jgi:GT2 family glycosyltransferase
MAGVSVSVVICAYAFERWPALLAAVTSVRRQTQPPREIAVVVDHNRALLDHARQRLARVTVVENRGERGLSGARNSGIAATHGDVVAFLDDDAVASPDWLERLTAAYADPLVAGVGGAIVPRWLGGRPAGFPPEFEWVVGCTYKGAPTASACVRNLIGANMSFRREVFEQMGGFRADVGRVGQLPTGCEETELCIRTRQRLPRSRFCYEPRARVTHAVPPARATWRYFGSRCFAEGRSKARVSASAGPRDGLASERTYALRTLPAGTLRGLADAIRGDASGVVRSAAIVAGLSVTTAGYLTGVVGARRDAGVHAGAGRLRALEVDLAAPLPDVDAAVAGRTYRGAHVLVRRDGVPLGLLRLDLRDGDLTAAELAARIASELGPAATHAPGPSLHAEHAQRISVVVPTSGSVDRLAACLDTLLAGDHRELDVVVVDNAPDRPATADLLRRRYGGDARVRRVAEPRPGAVPARNAGLAAAREALVAFADDDVLLDRRWLSAICAAFASDADVDAVTTLILPRELETPAQRWLEQFGGFAKGCHRRTFDLRAHRPPDPLYPYSPGTYGSGAGMAFRTRALRELGGFDTRLSTGGEDLDAFLKVILSGRRLAYEPSAIAWHHHHPDARSARRTMFRYGAGLTALMTKWLVRDPGTARDIARRVPAGLRLALDPRSRKNAGKRDDYPATLTLFERAGMLAGPFLYATACLRTRRVWRNPRERLADGRPSEARTQGRSNSSAIARTEDAASAQRRPPPDAAGASPNPPRRADAH